MNSVHIDDTLDDDDRREALYQGEVFTYTPILAAENFCRFANDLIRNAFDVPDPETAQWEMQPEDFVKIMNDLKIKFLHHPESRQFIQHILFQSGCDLEKTYFDGPRLRTSTSDNYLAPQIATLSHPHRDTWHSAPFSQINWWLPVYEIESGNCLAIYPTYWDKPIKNNSGQFSYSESNESWDKRDIGLKETPALQPGPQEPLFMHYQLRIVCRPGGMILFSGAHLHSSVPNWTHRTRYSIDFWTINYDDLVNGRGAHNLDADCKEATLNNFLRASDFSPLPDDLINSMHRDKLQDVNNIDRT